MCVNVKMVCVTNMFGVHSAALKLLSLCLFLLTLSGVTLGQQHGPGVKVVVKEGDRALLPCSPSTKENMESKLFDWTKDAQKDEPRKEVFLFEKVPHYINGRIGQTVEFRGRVSHFQDELKHGNTSIMIRNTKVTDSGKYTCKFPKLQPPEEYNIELVVELVLKDRSGEHEAATPKPYIWTLNITLDGALLQCEVRGAAPEPHVQWQDGAGNVLHAVKTQNRGEGGRFYISLFTTVTKTDVYRCVVTQDDIRHQTQAETFVPFYVFEDPSGKVAPGWLFGTFVLGAFIVLAFQALLVALKRIAILHNKGRRLQDNGPRNQDNGPRNQDNGPRNQDNGPRNLDNGPHNQHNGPRNQDNGPRNQDNSPRNQDNGPSKDPSEAVPLRKLDV